MLLISDSLKSSAKIRFFSHIGTIIKVEYAHFTDILPLGAFLRSIRSKENRILTQRGKIIAAR